MGTIKDINGKDLVDAEEIRRDGKNAQKNCAKKILISRIAGVVSHPEPDLLESKVKWALGSTAGNKGSEFDRIPVQFFKTLKDDAIKVLHSICQQI